MNLLIALQVHGHLQGGVGYYWKITYYQGGKVFCSISNGLLHQLGRKVEAYSHITKNDVINFK